MLFTKVPRYHIYISSLITLAICAGVYFFFVKKNNTTQVAATTTGQTCDVNVARIKGTKFTKPLLYAEPSSEAEYLLPLKQNLQDIISGFKDNGTISSASVYIRSFKDAQWLSINNDEKFSPGSLMKVPELIAYYKMEEKNPGFLNKPVKYDHQLVPAAHRYVNFESKHIVVGQTYTIKDLLYYMIVYSDNDATMLLNSMIDKDIFTQVFTDAGLPVPDYTSNDYPITAREFSVFMKELYNSSYLSSKASEDCLTLMNQCKFKEGLIAGLPKDVLVVNKFGESGPSNFPDLGESAVVYINDKAYLITVFVRGKDIKKMPVVLSHISTAAYKYMSR